MSQETNRRLTAILAADVVGFSRLVAEDEEATLARLAGLRSSFADHISGHRGRIFNTAGDAVRAEFQSAGDAVRCAVTLQRCATELEADVPEARRIRMRIGVALGDVVDSGGDLLGDGVSLAETLEAAAPVGGLCISRAVHDAVAAKSGLAFEAARNVMRGGVAVPAFVVDLARGTGKPGVSSMHGMHEDGGGGGNGQAAPSGGLGWKVLGVLGVLTFVGVFAAVRLLQPAPPPVKTAATAPAVAPVAAPARPPAAESLPANPEPRRAEPRPPQTVQPEAKSDQPKPQPKSAGGDAASERTKSADPGVPQGETKTAVVTPPATEPPTARPGADVQAFARAWQDCSSGQGESQVSACKTLLSGPGTLSDADVGRINHNLGRAELKLGHVEPALAALTTSVDKAPTAEAYVARGLAYHRKGDVDAAVRDFTEALKRDPGNGEALNNRAWSRYQLKQQKAALADADAAVKAIPDKAYVWDTRGHIHEALGDKPAAIADYKKAIEIDPNAKDSRDALARLGAGP